MADWYEELFDERYVGFYEGLDAAPFAEADVAFLERALDLSPGMSVLDLGCGQGRHAIPLAERGYKVTGLDLSPTMLRRARHFADEQGAAADRGERLAQRREVAALVPAAEDRHGAGRRAGDRRRGGGHVGRLAVVDETDAAAGLDSADGQLARITERYSSFGAIIDGLCDNLVFLAIYAAIVLGVWQRTGGGLLPLSALAIVAALSHSVQSSLVTYQRFLYLNYVYGKRDIEELAPDNLERKVRSTGSFYTGANRCQTKSGNRLQPWQQRFTYGHASLLASLACRGIA